MYSPVFVVGTGRSGTHFLTSVLITSSELTDLTGGRENPAVFKKVTESAISQKKAPELNDAYDGLVRQAFPLRLVDQSHPNLWRVDEILNQFPDAKLLGMVRDPFSVTFSTLNHPGVRARLKDDKWRGYPQPCPFFGLEDPFLSRYDKYSLVERSALRWCSHMSEISRSVSLYKKNFMVVNYENLLTRPNDECGKISDFLNLTSPVKVANPRLSSLNKASSLSDFQVEEIRGVINEYFCFHGFPNENVIPVNKYIDRFSA